MMDWVRAAIYARISKDDEGTALGVQRQIEDCRKLARAKGWDVIEPVELLYVDNDRSAYNAKDRPDYQRLLADIDAGKIDALIVWDVDRLTRTPRELEDIIALADKKQIALASVGGEFDLATPSGRAHARMKGVFARLEVEQMSRRIQRKTLERAEAGKPHGFVPYGWQRVVESDEHGRYVSSRDILHPEQAAVIREAIRRLLEGESQRSISADFSKRCIPSPRGKEWDGTMLRQVILRERNAGLRVHQKRKQAKQGSNAVIGKGDWEPIVDESTYDRLVALMKANRGPGTTARRHLLTGIALCGRCDPPTPLRSLVGQPQHGTINAYSCPRCFLRRKMADVDFVVEQAVLGLLERADTKAALAGADESQVQAALDNAEAVRARLNVAADNYAEGLIDGEQLARITAKLRPELERYESEARAQSAHPDLMDLTTPDIRRRWETGEISLDRKRAVIRVLVEVKVQPLGSGKRDDLFGAQVTRRSQ